MRSVSSSYSVITYSLLVFICSPFGKISADDIHPTFFFIQKHRHHHPTLMHLDIIHGLKFRQQIFPLYLPPVSSLPTPAPTSPCTLSCSFFSLRFWAALFSKTDASLAIASFFHLESIFGLLGEGNDEIVPPKCKN